MDGISSTKKSTSSDSISICPSSALHVSSSSPVSSAMSLTARPSSGSSASPRDEFANESLSVTSSSSFVSSIITGDSNVSNGKLGSSNMKVLFFRKLRSSSLSSMSEGVFFPPKPVATAPKRGAAKTDGARADKNAPRRLREASPRRGGVPSPRRRSPVDHQMTEERRPCPFTMP